MFRTATCGELRLADADKQVTLAGWVQKVRNLGAMIFIDLRDRYGITQITVDEHAAAEVKAVAESLGREYVVQVTGWVAERSAKNPKMETGEVEILAEAIRVLNVSEVPPFTIEENSDGGDDLRMKYRYLDLRRAPLQRAMMLRHRLAQQVRRYLDEKGFMEIETPYLIKSTPEGARDFVVPSRMNLGEFYALPQSPQTFKQLLMVSGYDRYFQIVRCFRDEDLRADRQPEFTQVDCEMAFVEREDVLEVFEGMMRTMFAQTLGVTFESDRFPRMSWTEAMERYGSDKPDIRFGMEFNDMTAWVKGHDFVVFDGAEYVGGICVPGCASYTRKQLDGLTEFVKRPQVGAKGLVYVRREADGSYKSSVDKFYAQEDLAAWGERVGMQPGDLLLILAGAKKQTLAALCALRLEMGDRLGLRPHDTFAPLWVVDFPLLEWDDETQRYYAMHHPFTSPKTEDMEKFFSGDMRALGDVRAEAYDFVVNGVEVGGGSIRIHDGEVQSRMFEVLGFTPEEAQAQFGFLLGAFKYGAPPHGGIAFGFDRMCSLFGGSDSIRDFIAFPKNNSGRDMMIDAPSPLAASQLDELQIAVAKPEA
ncbi:MAG TPA: aspartate--tRNA ligase [Candidatus Rikenella faecigallinarum]|uniref:Aspartate--tRNA ligase n=1 Tax=Candidatus Rikenella faecigallinarum TaxID=2838745 RepID=A0A9D1QFX9_9BACT|nr:aspartate--tRNA ligase [Candidatus Rikenella faecigallinarum]